MHRTIIYLSLVIFILLCGITWSTAVADTINIDVTVDPVIQHNYSHDWFTGSAAIWDVIDIPLPQITLSSGDFLHISVNLSHNKMIRVRDSLFNDPHGVNPQNINVSCSLATFGVDILPKWVSNDGQCDLEFLQYHELSNPIKTGVVASYEPMDDSIDGVQLFHKITFNRLLGDYDEGTIFGDFEFEITAPTVFDQLPFPTTSFPMGGITFVCSWNDYNHHNRPPNRYLLEIVPEPVTLSLFALGGLALLWRKRR